jgi:choline-sulfatase
MPKSASAGMTLDLAGPQQGEAQPRNLLIFIRDQVKPEDLWLPRNWARENLPNQQWLKDNGLSFRNAFTNSAMCTAARASFFTSKFPAQHEVGLVLSDIQNPILDSQIQLSPDLPNLATVLKDQGYDVGFIGKAHLSKTFTLDKGTADTADDEVVYQDLTAYGFDDWQGPDSGQDMELQNFGGGHANHDAGYTQQAVDWLTNRAASGSEKPFCLVVSLVNPHDVLSYPNTYIEGGYSEDWLQGDIRDLPPTVSEDLRVNLKPSVQSQWRLLQYGGQPLFSDQEKLNYLNFYGNLLKDVDTKMGEVLDVLRSDVNLGLLKDTMIVSTSDHGEMGMSHGGLTQ